VIPARKLNDPLQLISIHQQLSLSAPGQPCTPLAAPRRVHDHDHRPGVR
jgi:hypothetical protein